MPASFYVRDHLRLEVERDQAPGELVNLHPNPSGELGSWGYTTPRPGTVITASTRDTAGVLCLSFTTAYQDDGAGNYFDTEPMPITGGNYVKVSWRTVVPRAFAVPGYTVRLFWLDANGSNITSTAEDVFTEVTDTTNTYGPFQAPANAVSVMLAFTMTNADGTKPYTHGGDWFDWRELTVCQAATAAELADLSAAVPTPYTDTLAGVSELHTIRQDLNTGTLSGTFIGPALDPAVSDALRPGRRFRITADNPDTGAWEPIITGTLTNATAAYSPMQTDPDRRTTITLTATDPVAQLANARRPDSVPTIDELPYVLEGCGVPWNVNGSGNQWDPFTPATVVTSNPNATALDQVALARDTERGYAWVDRFGVLQAWTGLPGDPDYQAVTSGEFTTAAAADAWFWTGCDVATGVAATPAPADASPVARLTSNGSVSRMLIAQDEPLSGVSIPVFPGRTYTLTAEVKAGTSAPPRRCAAYITWQGIDGETSISQSGGDSLDDYTPDDPAAWQVLTLTAVAPVNARFATIIVAFISDDYTGDPSAGTPIPAGEVHLVNYVRLNPVVDPTPITEADYNPNVSAGFNTDQCITAVSVHRRWTDPTGHAQETVYGPYVDAESITRWGRHEATFTVAGTDPALIPGYAQAVLDANANPEPRFSQVQIAVTDAAKLPHVFRDLYDLVTVSDAATGMSTTARITGVSHDVIADAERPERARWLVTLDLTPATAVASPTAQPAVKSTAAPQIVQTGTLVLPANGDPATGTITFPTPFSAPPIVVANTYNSFASAAITDPATEKNAKVTVRRFDDTPMAAQQTVTWIAVGPA